ncbi:hypothetical protein [Aeromonas caviae]|nr:hypothetical protein [Aeromonas caviae]
MLPTAVEKTLIEVGKAATYAVWKERNAKQSSAEIEDTTYKGH